MPSAELKSATRAPIPPALQELLEREAVLTMSRKRIAEARTSAEKAAPSGALARPLLSLFSRKDNRVKLRENAETLALLEAGLKQIESIEPVLNKCLERSIDNFLRENDTEYANGLAASRFIDDWNRLLARFEAAVGNCLDSLCRLGAAIKSSAPGTTCGKHEETRRRIDHAVISTLALQGEISFLNKIADAQRIRAGVDAITLFRQRERNWRSAVHSLQFVECADALYTLGVLQEDIGEAVTHVRRAIVGECQLASYAVGYGITSYVMRVWASLRESTPLGIDPAKLESILSETEDLINTGRLHPWEPAAPEAKPTSAPPVPKAPFGSLPSMGPPPESRPPKPEVGGVPLRQAPSASPSLKLPSRGERVNGSPPASPAPGGAPAAASAVPGGAPDPMVDLMAERSRLEQILMETRASLTERETFLNESESRLMKASQDQIERQVELEQREEQLRDLEKRLREMQASLGLAPAQAAAGTADKPPADRDEFNE